jgi:hypothetical protein
VKHGEPEPFDSSFVSASGDADDAPKQFGKNKRAVAAVKPGAVAVNPGQPEPFDSSFVSASGDADDAPKQFGKNKRAVAAVKPGAVAVKPGEPEPVDSSFTRESDDEYKSHGKSKRSVAANKPGAVSVQPGEPEAFNSSVGAIGEKSHQSPSFHASTGAINSSVSRQHEKSKRSTATVLPGAVSVEGEEPDTFHGSMNDAPSTSSRQHGKSKLLLSAAVPGAVAMKSEEEPDVFHGSTGPMNIDEKPPSSQYGKSKRKTAPTVPGAVPASTEEPSSFNMSGGVTFDGELSGRSSGKSDMSSRKSDVSNSNIKSGRKLGAVTAGAVAMNDVREPDSSLGSSARDVDAMAKYGGSNNRSSIDSSKAGVTSVSGVDAQIAEETRRSKDPRSSVKERSSANGNAVTAVTITSGAVGVVAASNDDAEISNEEYRRRMHDKIEQMERLHSAQDSESDSVDVSEQDDDTEKSEPFLGADTEKELEVEVGGSPGTENVAAQGMTSPPDPEYGQVGDDETRLAVAMAVDEEDTPMLPAAIEYDPDSKPPLYRNRRFRLYMIALVIVSLVVIVAVVVGVVTRDDGAPGAPTAAPTTTLESTYREQFASEVGDKVYKEGSPYYRAANWVMFEDPLRLQPEAPNLIQRYHMALFYFLTTSNGEKPWNTCNPPGENESDKCTYIGDEIEGIVDANATRWLSKMHECEWHGVFCDPVQNIIALEVCKYYLYIFFSSCRDSVMYALTHDVTANQNISTTLPTEISSMPYLQAIAFYYNEVRACNIVL